MYVLLLFKYVMYNYKYLYFLFSFSNLFALPYPHCQHAVFSPLPKGCLEEIATSDKTALLYCL